MEFNTHIFILKFVSEKLMFQGKYTSIMSLDFITQIVKKMEK